MFIVPPRCRRGAAAHLNQDKPGDLVPFSLPESVFLSLLLLHKQMDDGITSTTAQFFAVICNASLEKMSVITASVLSTQSMPREQPCRCEGNG
ncbi:hypothetical protein NQZ68_007419 [Dissostichus eleginoides]|nr:hypothetical protein NQZ68_007419 [Dissostichus eleginoides]